MTEQESIQRNRFAVEILNIRGTEVIFVDIEHEDEAQLPSNWLQRLEGVTADFGADDLFLVEYYPPDFVSQLSKIPVLSSIISDYIDQKIGPSYTNIYNLAKERGSSVAVADIANNLGSCND